MKTKTIKIILLLNNKLLKIRFFNKYRYFATCCKILMRYNNYAAYICNYNEQKTLLYQFRHTNFMLPQQKIIVVRGNKVFFLR